MEIPKIKLPISSFDHELYLIIPAAGTGSRMHLPDSKQFLEIAGIPVLARTLLAFSEFSGSTRTPIHAVVVSGKDDIDRVRELCRKYECAFVEKVIAGGETRQESVRLGMEALSTLSRVPQDLDVVFIHDGARCMVDQETIRKCLAGGIAYEVCVAATPCKNTIKIAKENTGRYEVAGSAPLVDRTPDRSLLYEVQTPQVFKYKILREVLSRAKEEGITATDDTALAEALGIPVHLISCSYQNIKITTPEDAVIAVTMLNADK